MSKEQIYNKLEFLKTSLKETKGEISESQETSMLQNFLIDNLLELVFKIKKDSVECYFLSLENNKKDRAKNILERVVIIKFDFKNAPLNESKKNQFEAVSLRLLETIKNKNFTLKKD